MKIPASLLRQRILIEPYVGETGSAGPAWGPGRVVAARVEGTRRTVRTPEGTDVITSAVAFVQRDVAVAAQARVTCEGRTYTVLDVIDGQGLTAPTHRELMLS